MAQLVFLLVFLGTLVALIVIGTKLNMYLFSQGVLGPSRYSRVHPIGSLAARAERPSAEQRFYSSLGNEEDESTRYARHGIALIAVVFAIVVLAAVSLLAAVH